MSSTHLPPIEKLVGVEDFNDWKFAMRTYLEHENLWRFVEGEVSGASEQEKAKAKAKIILSVDWRNYTHIRECKSAKEVWDTLNTEYDDSGLTRKVSLLRTLINTKLEDCSSTEEYVNKICTTAQKLESMKFKIGEEWLGALLLAGLPEKYKPMIMGLESSGTAIKGEVIKTKLLQEVNVMDDGADSDSHNVFCSKVHRGKEVDYKSRLKNVKCYKCNKFGHVRKFCRQNTDENNEQSNTCGSDETNVKCASAWLTNCSNYGENDWYVDSGATKHMSPNRKNFFDFEAGKIQIQLADKRKVFAQGKGKIRLNLLVNGKMKKVILQEVLYIPSLAANLISLAKLTEVGLAVNFGKNKCEIFEKGILAAEAVRVKNMFKLKLFNEKTFVNRKVNVKESTSANGKFKHVDKKTEMKKSMTKLFIPWVEENKEDENLIPNEEENKAKEVKTDHAASASNDVKEVTNDETRKVEKLLEDDAEIKISEVLPEIGVSDKESTSQDSEDLEYFSDEEKIQQKKAQHSERPKRQVTKLMWTKDYVMLATHVNQEGEKSRKLVKASKSRQNIGNLGAVKKKMNLQN